MAHKKVNLDSKKCVVCQRPFTWRKKWENNWAEVKYCSERCRRNKNSLDISEEANALIYLKY